MSRLVLVGAGHAHALLLNAWHTQPLADVDLVLVAPVTQAPYSGMIPGWLAGQYRFDETVVDFVGLCKKAGATLIEAELTRLNPDAHTVELSDGQQLSYDWLSLNVGSTLRPPVDDEHPAMGDQPLADRLLAMRPLSTLQARYETWLAQWQNATDNRPLRLTAVGGGAAGVESLLCVKHRLETLRPDKPVHAQLITRGAHILPGFSGWARHLALAELHHANVTVQLGTGWCDTIAQSSDLVIWATGAQAHDWQIDTATRGSLQTDTQGFIAVDDNLRSVSHPNVFAVGDCAALPAAVPKAGVYAVRMASTLTHNIKAAITGTGQSLSPFTKRGKALALLNTANGSAIASWGPFGWQGKWVMRWKDRIDRGFINRLTCGI